MEPSKPSESPAAPPDALSRELQQVRALTGLTNTDDIVFVDSGWTSRVYVCNGGEWVIKFPRGEAVKREYAREIDVLALVNGVTTDVGVPRVRWTHDENEYLGYDGIVGTELASHTSDVGATDKRAIGAALGEFLSQLHRLTLPAAPSMSVHDEIREFQRKFEMSRAVIARDFTADEQGRLEHLVEVEMPEKLLGLGGDPVFCHGDLGYWNMILSPDGRVGVIDFGDAGYYDRSKDFMGIQDPELLDAALHAYGDRDVLREKIGIRQKLIYVLDLPFFIGKHDEIGIAATVARIRSGLTPGI